MSDRNSVRRFTRPRLECLEAREVPTAGLLDPTFGTAGLVTNSSAFMSGSMAVQPDGKIIVAGQTQSAGPGLFGSAALFRYNANGSLDTHFGKNGMVLAPTSSPANGMSSAGSLLQQPGGKIVALFQSSTMLGPSSQTLVRLTGSGQLDTTFGNAGVVSLPANFQITEVVLQPGGKLAAIGSPMTTGLPASTLEVMHYTANGKADSKFGTGGLVKYANANIAPFPAGLALQADGKLVISGSAPLDGPMASSLLVKRFNVDGSPDRSFHGTGSVLVSHPGLFMDPIDFGGITVQPDGKLLINDGEGGVFSLVRLDADGSVDKGFGAAGFATVRFSGAGLITGAPEVAVQSDGKILLAGTAWQGIGSTSAFGLARFTADGSLDPTFGAAGLVVTPFPGQNNTDIFVSGLALGPGQTVIVKGGTANGIALARYFTTDHAGQRAASHTTLAVIPANSISPVLLTATVSGKPGGTVAFFDGTMSLGAASVGPDGKATLAGSGLGAGQHHFRAVYSGDANHQPSSVTAVLTVARATPSIWMSPSSAFLTTGEFETFTVTLSSSLGQSPTGNVTFREGNTVLAIVPIQPLMTMLGVMPMPGTVTFSLANLMVGDHTYTASYSGDSNFAPVVSTPVKVSVSPPIGPIGPFPIGPFPPGL